MTHVLLIDGENTSSASAAAVLGLAPADCSIRRVYGDVRHLVGWDSVAWACVRHVAAGRAGIDFAMIIDAVTLAYGKGCREFTLVSAGSGFGRVVDHLREHGCSVSVLHVPGAAPAAGQEAVLDQRPMPSIPDLLHAGRFSLRVIPGFGPAEREEGAVRSRTVPQACDSGRARLRLVEPGPVSCGELAPEPAAADELDGSDRIRLQA